MNGKNGGGVSVSLCHRATTPGTKRRKRIFQVGEKLAVLAGMVFEKFTEYGAVHSSGLRQMFHTNLPN